VAHPTQMAFFTSVVERFPGHFAGRVLDVGSADLLGGPHTLMTTDRYVGVDLARQANVDVAARGEALPFPSRCFDVAMSSECFEHAPEWRSILAAMVDATRPGGLVVISAAATGRLEHGTTRSDGGFASPATVTQGQEWYRNLSRRQIWRAILGRRLTARLVFVDRAACDLYVAALVRPARSADVAALRDLRRHVRADRRPNRGRRPLDERIVLRVAGDRGLASAKALWMGWRRVTGR